MSVEIIGHAVVSADGMIADARGEMPADLRNEADWRRFQAALDAAKLVVLGRIGHLRHPNPGRRRLVVTSRTTDLATDPGDPNATLWNPAGMEFDRVLEKLGILSGVVAITGGQRVFDLFLGRFTRFDLVEMPAVTIRDGIACFSSDRPETVLAAAGLHPATAEPLEPGVILTVWRR